MLNEGLYIIGLSFITPPLLGHNICKLYNYHGKINWTKSTLQMVPTQTLLRSSQFFIASHIKDNTNVWVGFASIGIMQGIIYGHCNTQWAKIMNIKTRTNPFRGLTLAACRDTISQGIPFNVSHHGALSTIGITFAMTILSQPFHNCQTMLQTNNNISIYNVLKVGFSRHGLKFLYLGFESRLGIMTLTNLLNYTFLSNIWKIEKY